MVFSGCLAGLAILALSCAHEVRQDAATGIDGTPTGAKLIRLEHGRGEASGIVTYPGGDRADWTLIELPDRQRGTLDLQLSWTPPRPGLQLAFDVFDASNQRIAARSNTRPASPHASNRNGGGIRSATVEGAHGSYQVRIYAVGRGDAGRYRLTAAFNAEAAAPAFDPPLDVPDPPRLPAVVEPPVEPPVACDSCGMTVDERCPSPPDVNVPACWWVMECPNPPDRRIKRCRPPSPCPGPGLDCENLPVLSRIIAAAAQPPSTIITIGVGSSSGVTDNWTVTVLRGDTDQPLPGGDVTVVRVGRHATVGKTLLPVEQLQANPRVKLRPP